MVKRNSADAWILFQTLFITSVLSTAACTNADRTDAHQSILTDAQTITGGLEKASKLFNDVGMSYSYGNSWIKIKDLQKPEYNCNFKGEPGVDTNKNGVVEDSELISVEDKRFSVKKFFCALTFKGEGSETTYGAIEFFSALTCAINSQIGGLKFDGTTVRTGGITIDKQCASPALLKRINSNQATEAVTIAIPVEVLSSKNPVFEEMPNNHHYSHGIKISSLDSSSLKLILLSKVESSGSQTGIADLGGFEFATYISGVLTLSYEAEISAGRIEFNKERKGNIWFESRLNGLNKTGVAKHIRLKAEVELRKNSVPKILNVTGVYSEGFDAKKSKSGRDASVVATITGNSNEGYTGKLWKAADRSRGPNLGISPNEFNDDDKLFSPNTFSTVITSCSYNGKEIGEDCAKAPTPHEPIESVTKFVNPAGGANWLGTLAASGGIGFATSATLSETQTKMVK